MKLDPKIFNTRSERVVDMIDRYICAVVPLEHRREDTRFAVDARKDLVNAIASALVETTADIIEELS